MKDRTVKVTDRHHLAKERECQAKKKEHVKPETKSGWQISLFEGMGDKPGMWEC